MLDDAKLDVEDDEERRRRRRKRKRTEAVEQVLITYPIVEVDDTVNYAAGGLGVLRLQIRQRWGWTSALVAGVRFATPPCRLP